MVKRQLSNDMPRRLLESYFVLIRPDGMGVARWCIFSTQTYDLVVSEAFTTVGLLIRWNLFDGQVTTDEWRLTTASGDTIYPGTDALKVVFD